MRTITDLLSLLTARPRAHLTLFLWAVLLLGAAEAQAQIRTVLVSPVAGNPVASGTALQAALAGIAAPSATNPWMLKSSRESTTSAAHRCRCAPGSISRAPASTSPFCAAASTARA